MSKLTLFAAAAAQQNIKILDKHNEVSESQYDRFISISQRDGIFYYKDKDGNKIKFDETNLANVKIVSVNNDTFLWQGKSIKSTKFTLKNFKTNKIHVLSLAHGTSKWRECAKVLFDINERASDFTFKLVQTKDFINLVIYEGNRRLQWVVDLPAARKVQVNGSMVSDYTEANEICDKIYAEVEKVFTSQSLVSELTQQKITHNEEVIKEDTQKQTTPLRNPLDPSIEDVLASFGL